MLDINIFSIETLGADLMILIRIVGPRFLHIFMCCCTVDAQWLGMSVHDMDTSSS